MLVNVRININLVVVHADSNAYADNKRSIFVVLQLVSKFSKFC